ncbi:nitrile hydratase [Streptomyces sp. NPDC090021]|uniref:nitrile hydratase n=1 Tax=Streptomyces sp. NPDC090021 TaxID=3365919 RepID=UPI003827C4FF
MKDEPEENAGSDGPGSLDLEQALTILAWSDPALTENPGAALTRLGIDVPPALRFDVRVQRPDTLYLVIPPVSCEEDGGENVVNQMDLWRSGEQFVWILPQDAKTSLLGMREQYRNRGGGEGR